MCTARGDVDCGEHSGEVRRGRKRTLESICVARRQGRHASWTTQDSTCRRLPQERRAICKISMGRVYELSLGMSCKWSLSL